jgi:DNA-binding PadR family transcriptional regulator
MASALTTTSYAVLGLLAVRPWSTYELTQQMSRSLGHMWPRATSKLYEEPKKLVDNGLARCREEMVGRRKRTVYSITAKGRRAMATWLHEPGAPPALEFEQLLKVFFSDSGHKDDTLATLAAARAWAEEMSGVSAAIGREYLDEGGPFPERMAQQVLTTGFLNELYALVHRWSIWAEALVRQWPDEPTVVTVDRGVIEEIQQTAERVRSR